MKWKLPLVVAALFMVLGCGPKTPPRTAPRRPAATRPPKSQPPKTQPPVEAAPRPQPSPKPVTPREPVPAQPESPAPAPPREPLLVKVGLASDLESVIFPCCEETLDVAVES